MCILMCEQIYSVFMAKPFVTHVYATPLKIEYLHGLALFFFSILYAYKVSLNV